MGDGAVPENFTTVAEVLDLHPGAYVADVAEVTGQLSSGGFKEKIPTLLDAGACTFDLNYVIQNSTQSYSAGLFGDFSARKIRDYKVVFPDANSTTWSFRGFIKEWKPVAALKDALKVAVTIEFTGQPTFS